MLDFVVGVRSCGISMIRNWNLGNLLFFLGNDRLMMDFLGIDSGSGWVITV